MKSFDTELQKYAQKVRLKAAERRMLRERILSYMEYHPLPKERSLPLHDQIESQHFVAVHFNTWYARLAGAAFVFFILIGVPIAAERSVPGDALYFIKTGINENIQAQFANSPYERVAFETRLMERRIAEARLLAQEGKLTEEVEAEIAEVVKSHASAAQDSIAALRESDADEAAIAEIAYGSALEIQSAVLDVEGDEESASSTDSIRDAVMLARAAASERRGTSLPSYERLMARIESETTRAVELYESIKESATPQEQQNIERRFDDINRAITDAKEITDAGEAITELAKSLGLIQKLIVFMTDIDIRENVSLDELIPIELTDEERTVIVQELFAEVISMQAEIESRIAGVEEDDFGEKIILGNAELKRNMEEVRDALEAEDVDAAESALAESYALAIDLDALTKDIPAVESATTTATSTPEAENPDDETEESEEQQEEAAPEEELGTTTEETGVIEEEATSTEEAATDVPSVE